jgi:hypothetical protein
MMVSNSIHFPENYKISFFFMTVDMLHFLYPFIACWAPQLILQCGTI